MGNKHSSKGHKEAMQEMIDEGQEKRRTILPEMKEEDNVATASPEEQEKAEPDEVTTSDILRPSRKYTVDQEKIEVAGKEQEEKLDVREHPQLEASKKKKKRSSSKSKHKTEKNLHSSKKVYKSTKPDSTTVANMKEMEKLLIPSPQVRNPTMEASSTTPENKKEIIMMEPLDLNKPRRMSISFGGMFSNTKSDAKPTEKKRPLSARLGSMIGLGKEKAAETVGDGPPNKLESDNPRHSGKLSSDGKASTPRQRLPSNAGLDIKRRLSQSLGNFLAPRQSSADADMLEMLGEHEPRKEKFTSRVSRRLSNAFSVFKKDGDKNEHQLGSPGLPKSTTKYEGVDDFLHDKRKKSGDKVEKKRVKSEEDKNIEKPAEIVEDDDFSVLVPSKPQKQPAHMDPRESRTLEKLEEAAAGEKKRGRGAARSEIPSILLSQNSSNQLKEVSQGAPKSGNFTEMDPSLVTLKDFTKSPSKVKSRRRKKENPELPTAQQSPEKISGTRKRKKTGKSSSRKPRSVPAVENPLVKMEKEKEKKPKTPLLPELLDDKSPRNSDEAKKQKEKPNPVVEKPKAADSASPKKEKTKAQKESAKEDKLKKVNTERSPEKEKKKKNKTRRGARPLKKESSLKPSGPAPMISSNRRVSVEDIAAGFTTSAKKKKDKTKPVSKLIGLEKEEGDDRKTIQRIYDTIRYKNQFQEIQGEIAKEVPENKPDIVQSAAPASHQPKSPTKHDQPSSTTVDKKTSPASAGGGTRVKRKFKTKKSIQIATDDKVQMTPSSSPTSAHKKRGDKKNKKTSSITANPAVVLNPSAPARKTIAAIKDLDGLDI